MRKGMKTMLAVLALVAAPGRTAAQTADLSGTVLKLDAGISLITSKVYTYNFSDQRIHQTTWKPEFCGKFDFEHYWKSGWGVGLNVVHQRTTFDVGMDGYDNSGLKGDTHLRQWYVGPCGAYRFRLGERWLSSVSLGLGYALVREDFSEKYVNHVVEHSSGLGIMEKVGVEYLLSPHVGLGLELMGLTTFVEESDEAKQLKSVNEELADGFNGFHRLAALAGLRLYF